MVKNSNEYRNAVEKFGVDLVDALYYNDCDTLITGIKSILASVKGEPGGNAWFWLLAIDETEDGAFAVVRASCGADGWVGESDCEVDIFTSAERALRFVIHTPRYGWALEATKAMHKQLEKAK